MDITSSVLRDQHYAGAKHEKKVRMRLSELIPDDAARPKKIKLGDDSSSEGLAAAESFLKKLENQVKRLIL